MIDKIELRLPPHIDFRPLVQSQLRQAGRTRPGLHYTGALDLRPHGLDAMLHYRKRRQEASHKLELFETGKKNYSEMAALIENVVEGDTGRLEFMRIDLCADIPDVPVEWFHAHARIRFKQKERQIGALKSDLISKTELETLVAGSRPNVLRIYNKSLLWRTEFRKACKKQSRDADALEFAREFGIPHDAVLTRIERQYGGRRLPRELPTFTSIVKAAAIDPFEYLDLHSGEDTPPQIGSCDIGEWLKGMQLRHEAQKRGMNGFRKWLNLHSGGNAARMMKTYAAYLPGKGAMSVTKAEIVRIYRESTSLQLAA